MHQRRVRDSLRVLLVGTDDESPSLRGVLRAALAPVFHVEHALNGWDAHRLAVGGNYDAVVLDSVLSDTDGETLLGRLRALGASAPALLLTRDSSDQGLDRESDAAPDDCLPNVEARVANTLARAIAAMVDRHELVQELTAAREQAARATAALSTLRHDLATPLGVILGMSQVLLVGQTEWDADDRECLEDVHRAATQAGEILKQSVADAIDPTVILPASSAPDLSRVTRPVPGNRIVLIADDDPASRRMVSATLASDEYSVLQAADGQEAWRLIRQHRPAVVILDWQMPVYTGLELSDVIKGDPQLESMTVIMLTGRTTAADREAGAQAGADLYLTKPFSPAELLGVVQRALDIS
jgi:DNA-binding response OmpR family regulator